MNRNKRNLIILAVVCGLCLLALYLLPGCDKKPDLQAQLHTAAAQRDSARVALLLCNGIYSQQQAIKKYEEIATAPASGWSDDSLTRYLSDPYHLHPKAPGSPQRR